MPTIVDELNIFYVYEHWRPDQDVCFWVGKGKGKRAYDFEYRNFHYGNIIKKLRKLGMCAEVRLVRGGLRESVAFGLEKERIVFWRSVGVNLTNCTDGGEGVSGLKHSDETRKKIKAKRAKQKIAHSAETRAKIGAANKISHPKGTKNPEHGAKLRGRKHSAEHCAKISAANMGRVFSEETKAKISAAHTGMKRSEETRARLVTSHLGKTASTSTRKKMSAKLKERWSNQNTRDSLGLKMKSHWLDPVYRQKVMEARKITAADPAYSAKLSAAAKADWARRKEAQVGSNN